MDNFVISLTQNLEISETLKLNYLLRKYIFECNFLDIYDISRHVYIC